MKKITVLLSFILILSPCIMARDSIYNEETEDYRPVYNFSYDVFRELPKVPQDFWVKQRMMNYSEIDPSRFTEEYYLQPEMIPYWESWANRTYSDPINRTQIGIYGLSAFPSLFTIFKPEVGDFFQISAILHVGWGINFYQGIKLVVENDETKSNVELLSDNNMIFPPTFPYFHKNWSRIITIRITILSNESQEIVLKEDYPDEEYEEQWIEEYGEMYTSAGSILALKIPKFKVRIVGIESNISNEKEIEVEKPENNYKYLLLIPVILGGLYGVRRTFRSNKKKKKTKTIGKNSSTVTLDNSSLGSSSDK